MQSRTIGFLSKGVLKFLEKVVIWLDNCECYAAQRGHFFFTFIFDPCMEEISQNLHNSPIWYVVLRSSTLQKAPFFLGGGLPRGNFAGVTWAGTVTLDKRVKFVAWRSSGVGDATHELRVNWCFRSRASRAKLL